MKLVRHRGDVNWLIDKNKHNGVLSYYWIYVVSFYWLNAKNKINKQIYIYIYILKDIMWSFEW
jgi:hypothetical protein